MKVALVGNMNNNFFSLTRYFRDNGIEANLYIFQNEHDHFRPHNDCFNNDYNKYTKILDWTVSRFGSLDKHEVRREFEIYDIIICQGVALAYFYKSGIWVHFFIPYGSDLYELPFLKTSSGLTKLKGFIKGLLNAKWVWDAKHQFSLSQKKGIQASSRIVLFNKEWQTVVGKLYVEDKWDQIPIPMVYSPGYVKSEFNKYMSDGFLVEKFDALKKSFDFIVLSHCRHYWKNHSRGEADRYSNKGNDKLIIGFANYLRKDTRSTNPVLVFLDYGPDVDSSKELIEQMGIQKNVIWLPRLSRKEIMYLISQSDIVCNEFNNSWIGGGVIFEALSMGKPLMGYREHKLYNDDSIFEELYPMINVSSIVEIEEAFQNYLRDPSIYVQMGADGREWYENNVVNKSLKYFFDNFEKENLE